MKITTVRRKSPTNHTNNYMNKNIPIYQLSTLTEPQGNPLGVFFFTQKLEHPKVPIDIPYRGNFYKIGICLQGRAELKANLKTYTIEPHCLIAISPHVINQWTSMSDDFQFFNLFFTKDFITTNNNLHLDKFHFLDSVATHSFQITAAQSKNIIASFKLIQQKYETPHAYRNEILKNLINSLLFETESLYDEQSVVSNAAQTRSELLASEFVKLVNTHSSIERSVKFYANKIFISPKHLTKTVKEITGKTAGEWIDETVILDAKVLLQNPSLTVSQISDILHFADPFTFSKFFKRTIGVSPIAYKQTSKTSFRLLDKS